MSDIFYKSIKLKTGEVIACALHTNHNLESIVANKYVTLIDPIVYSSFRFMDPKMDQLVDATSMQPFNMTTNDHEIIIATDQVVSVSSLRKTVIDRYKKFVSQLEAYNLAGDVLLNNNEQLNQEDMLEELKYQSLLNMPTDNQIH